MPQPRATSASVPPQPLVCDTSRKYVRVTDLRADGLVAFEFSIGWPELAVELMLPRTAFDEFCAANRVTRLGPRSEEPIPAPNDEETDE